ncbi:MAG: flippase-like domain-containing protein, partial [Bdellovibrionales bacterium]|nr:flippase-like domain-containing protein [Bdellovibrionales bacterium]
LVSLSWVFGPRIATALLKNHERTRQTIENTSKGFPQSFRCIASITFLSLCFHSFQIFLHWIICIGLNAPVPITVLFTTIPFINIFSSLPVSWNGLGVRESGYIFFLTPFYLTQEQVIAMGALWLLAATISSGIGGILSFLTRDDKVTSLLAPPSGDTA